MDFTIHHDICGEFSPGLVPSEKAPNERRHVDVSREPCLGDLSTAALEAVKAIKWSLWGKDELQLDDFIQYQFFS